MELTMKLALYKVLVDVGFMGMLLLMGQFLRAKVKLFQKLLIPPALIAGFLALIFGPKGLGWIPLSDGFGTYAVVLMIVVFAATPIGDKTEKNALSGPKIGGMFFNITGIAVLQYGVGMLLTVYVLRLFYPELSEAFGLMMATGFYGGHSTAMAVGSVLEEMGIANMIDLGNTCATAGIVGGILFGIVIINWGTRKGYCHYVTDPQDLPEELLTGLIPPEKQKASGKITVSNICVDQMAFHIAIVTVAAMGGYFITAWFKKFTAGLGYAVTVPEFCTALLLGFVINMILNKTGTQKYVDRQTISRIQGSCTDFLMISGVGSLNIAVVLDYAVPLLVVITAGFLVTFGWFLIVGAKSSPEDWFERNMMCWGHATGVAATGVMLQRVVDPEMKSRGIEDSGISDLFNRPIIIGLQVIPPIVISLMGSLGAYITTWTILAIVTIMWVVAWRLKWWVPSRKRKVYQKSTSAN